MPYQQPPNPQLCTLTVATTIANKLRNIGVSVGTIYEIGDDGVRYDTTSDLYESDGKPYQYVAIVWGGPEQNLGMIDDMFVRQGYNWGTFTRLGTDAGLGEQTDEAILELKNIYRAINAALTKQME
jgi:hypothetical protein